MPSNITSAIAKTARNPSQAQREAGNYRKGKIRLHGLQISIENPKGTRRKPEWKPLAHHYGYLNRTEGRDGDAVDVFVGPHPESQIVFVVDQCGPSGRFDEHKAMMGFRNLAEAKAGYLANYPGGWKCGKVTAMTVQQFKQWLAKGDTTKRVAGQVSRYDKSGGIPGIPAAGAQPGETHRVGETKSFNGTTYRLNENHRWELANPDEANPQQPGGQQPDQQPEAPNPANDQATRNAFSISRVNSVHPEIGGLMRAIHESPSFKQGGEFASFDVHQRVGADLHHSLSQRVGQDFGGGKVVDLGEGRVGFASEAGSVVVWPADERGRHQISYTNKTGIVGRAMQKGGQDGTAEATGNDQPPVETEPEAPPLPQQPVARAIPVAKPIAPPPGQQPPAKPQSAPSPAPTGKLADEQAYDDAVGPAKERQPHEQLRQRANSSRKKFEAAHAAYEQAVNDRERPDRIRKLKRHAVELREISNEHERRARRAEGEHRNRLKESGKATKERMKELGIGPGNTGKSPPSDPNQPKGTMPSNSAKLTRSFSAGNNRGSIEFESDQHRDLYDLGAKHSYVGRGGRNKTSDRHVGDIKALTSKLAESTGMSEQELRGHAAEVFKHTKGQMKGIGDGEHRKVKMPTAKDTAPLAEFADKNAGKGDVPQPTPEALEMGKLPMESQRAGSASQTYLKTAGLSVTPENHKAIQHAIRRGWVKNKAELRAMLKTAKKIHERGNLKNEDGSAASDHAALREAIRRKGNRERRESWAAIVKQKADHWEMPAKEFHNTATAFHKEFMALHRQREDVKDDLRKMVGASANSLRQIEERGGKAGRGGDYTNVKGMDNAAEYLRNNFPHLIEGDDAEQTAWEILKEGKKPPPGKTSPEFMEKFEEALGNGYSITPDYQPPELTDEQREAMKTADDSVPFAKVRAGVVLRY